MLALSTLPPRHTAIAPLVDTAFQPKLAQSHDDPHAVAIFLVRTMELGGIAALAIGRAGQIIASNAPLLAIVKDHAAMRDLLDASSAGKLPHKVASSIEPCVQPTMVFWRPTGGQVLLARRFAIGKHAACNGSGPITILMLQDPSAHTDLRFAEFVSHYKLTPAEARLLRKVLSGRGLTEASSRLGISIATAKTQLRSILARTGAARQSELVRIFFDDVAAG